MLLNITQNEKDEMIHLTKELVKVPSVNSTSGEKDIGEYIEDYLRKIPYFKNREKDVFIQMLKEDPLKRRNVFAFVASPKKVSKTVIFHGHTDTVGVDDYGQLSDVAFDPDALMERLQTMSLEPDVQKDLLSGDYMFGRGVGDMKSGIAVFLVLMKYMTDHLEDLNVNILLMFNPIEENAHTGIIEALDVLLALKEERGLAYIMAVNNDFTCPMYPGDTHRYVYTGSGGKLLPCFYAVGKETHVGQSFEGLDASMLIAELVSQVNCNPVYCDDYKGEFTLPPSVLKMQDLKDFYNVQTIRSAFAYFNLFVLNKSVPEISKMLVSAGESAFKTVIAKMDQQYKIFCEKSGLSYTPIAYDYQVLMFDQLKTFANHKYGAGFEETLKEKIDEFTKSITDSRMISLETVKWLFSIADIKTPTMIVFYAVPYCPHNTLKEDDENEVKLYRKINQMISEFSAVTGENYKVCRYFPSLSDSSYLKIDDDASSLNMLMDNFPGYETLYPLPFEKMKSLNIPALNYGIYGKDAHKWTERLYMPYSFEVLPNLILKTIYEIGDE